jgi:hypothetical protein
MAGAVLAVGDALVQGSVRRLQDRALDLRAQPFELDDLAAADQPTTARTSRAQPLSCSTSALVTKCSRQSDFVTCEAEAVALFEVIPLRIRLPSGQRTATDEAQGRPSAGQPRGASPLRRAVA